MTTWSQSIRHPWFVQPSMKRKPSATDIYDDDDSSSSDASTSAFSTTPRKRVKYTSLERGLAQLSLHTPVILGDFLSMPVPPEDVGIISPQALASSQLPPAQNYPSVILPSSIEEPSSPPSDSESVDMDVEPEVVTTDFTPVANPSHTADGQPDVKEIQISSALLERLREHTRLPPSLIPLPSQTSQALILYRPLPSPPRVPEDVCDDQLAREGHRPQVSPLVTFEEDAMDVE